MSEEMQAKNTDTEIWRKVKDDYYSPSIHVTETGGIRINVGGVVIVKPVEVWHRVMLDFMKVDLAKRLENILGKPQEG